MSTGMRGTLRFVQQENVRLRSENQRLRDEVEALRSVLDALRALQEVSASINVHTDLLNLLDRILQSALTSIGATDGSLLLLDDNTRELVFVVVHGAVEHSLVGYRIAPGTGVAGWVAKHKEAAMVPNVQQDSRFSHTVDQTFQFQTQSLICVPIIHGGEVLGVIQALNKVGEEFNQADLALLGVVAQLAAAAMFKADTILPIEEQAPESK